MFVDIDYTGEWAALDEYDLCYTFPIQEWGLDS